MSAEPWTLAEISAAILSYNSDSTKKIIAEIRADVPSSAETIKIWRSYLPKDCVDLMIQMGWHRSD
jgi:hypothetical protein